MGRRKRGEEQGKGQSQGQRRHQSWHQKVEGKRTASLCVGAWVLMGAGLEEIVEGKRKEPHSRDQDGLVFSVCGEKMGRTSQELHTILCHLPTLPQLPASLPEA